jgi:hypothetical protein
MIQKNWCNYFHLSKNIQKVFIGLHSGESRPTRSLSSAGIIELYVIRLIEISRRDTFNNWWSTSFLLLCYTRNIKATVKLSTFVLHGAVQTHWEKRSSWGGLWRCSDDWRGVNEIISRQVSKYCDWANYRLHRTVARGCIELSRFNPCTDKFYVLHRISPPPKVRHVKCLR